MHFKDSVLMLEVIKSWFWSGKRAKAVAILLLIAFAAGGCGAEKKPLVENEHPNLATRVEQTANERLDEVNPIAAAQVRDPLREDPFDRIDQLIQGGDLSEATRLLRHHLVAQPDDAQALFRLASLLAESGDLAQSIELLNTIPLSHPDAGLPALGQTADWCFQLEQYEVAEQKYLQLLELAPDAVLARRQLAYLLNRQGRRHEAAVHVRVLCEIGDIQQDELHSLVVLTNAMYDDPKQQVHGTSRPYWPIGASGQARHLMNQQLYVEASETLRPVVEGGDVPPAVLALYLRILIEAQDDNGFRRWLSKSTDSVQQFSDYWAALGTYLLIECRFEEAAKALGEAVDRDPTDLISIGRLRQALFALSQDSLAEKWEVRWRKTRDILRVNNRVSAAELPDPDLIGDLALRLHELDFKLQAILWKSIEAAVRGLPIEVQQELNVDRERLLKSNDAFPNQEERLCGMDLKKYSRPDLKRITPLENESVAGKGAVADHDSIRNDVPVIPQFINVATEVGLSHSFSVAAKPQESGFAIYQILGAAIAVLDYDLDGASDFYLGQGAADPPSFYADASNVFYRNVERKLIDVTMPSGTGEFRYSTGITSGDWNQDGFQDLAVANLGGDVLLINNGDGTFRSQMLSTDESLTRVPTSMAMADVTGDHLPDLFQLAYVDDNNIAKRPTRDSQGLVISSLVPTDFRLGKDRLIANSEDGTASLQSWDDGELHNATGLGVVVANLDETLGNEIFIGNDLHPNQLWQRNVSTGVWSEVALPLGCAYGFTGNATASMGITTGDFDANGTLDFHITNFQDDASSLFLLANGVYRDRNHQFQINASSRAVLGFGTQSIDFDNDGRLDIVVTNGHVEDETQSEAAFEQPPQLFRNMDGHFQLVEVSDASGYWSSRHLGRALARIDFNRDGKMDYLVTHLEAQTALLINQTDSQNHWLQLQLVGTQCERDAIGARVRVKTGDKESYHWVTAGDGYLCRNELVLQIGLGQMTQIDEMVIEWPSGTVQTIRNISADRRMLVIENEADAVEM